MTIGLIVILLSQLVFHWHQSGIARWVSVLGLSVLAYMALQYGPMEYGVVLITVRLLAPAIAVAVLGLSKSLFLEQTQLSIAEWTVALSYLTLSAINVLAPSILIEHGIAAKILFSTVPQLLMISLVLWALVITLRHITTDLVEVRRQLRYIFFIVLSGYTLLFLGSGLFYDYHFPAWLILTHETAIFLAVFSLNLWLFRFKSKEIEDLAGLRKPDVTPIPQEARINTGGDAIEELSPLDKNSLEKLEKLMLDEKAYREPGMTISSLAEQVDLREHQLRRLINQHLRYRNFNNYLNHYRIMEATSILGDALVSTPISSIAMDVGFNSLAPFNRAFKSATGLSPRDYRKSPTNQISTT